MVFVHCIGRKLIPGYIIFIKKYSHGGMSSGIVCSDFWIIEGFPMLISRIKKYQKVKILDTYRIPIIIC